MSGKVQQAGYRHPIAAVVACAAETNAATKVKVPPAKAIHAG
jgi:hypothetical protein